MFEPIELGFKAFDLFFDIFEFLQLFLLVAHDNHPPGQYLIMFDECIHPAEGGLEGGEPVSRLVRNVKENFCDVRDSLLFC